MRIFIIIVVLYVSTIVIALASDARISVALSAVAALVTGAATIETYFDRGRPKHDPGHT